MKKLLIILLSSILVFGITTPTLAHDWPSDIDDWSEDDWEAWNKAWRDHISDRDHDRDRRHDWDCDHDWDWDHHRDYNNYNPYPNNYNYNNYNYNYNYSNYSGYNFHSGILDVYDASTEDQAMVLARIMNFYGHGIKSQTTQAAIGWAVMNSVDIAGGRANVCTVAPNYYYDYSNNITDDFGRSLLPLARDVLLRWKAGRAGISDNGRVLPGGYWCIFSNGITATFGTDASSGSGSDISTFSYACPSPYGN